MECSFVHECGNGKRISVFCLDLIDLSSEEFQEFRGQQEQGDHVGNHDEADGHVRDVPDLLDGERGRDDGQGQEDELEEFHSFDSEQILDAGPEFDKESDVAGVGEQDDGKAQDDDADAAPDQAECVECHNNTGIAVGPDAAGDDSERGECTDDDGNDEDLQDPIHTLMSGMVCLCGRVDCCGGSHAGLIGEDTSCGASCHGQGNGGTQETADGRCGFKGILEDYGESSGNPGGIHSDDNNAAYDVDRDHGGGPFFRRNHRSF